MNIDGVNPPETSEEAEYVTVSVPAALTTSWLHCTLESAPLTASNTPTQSEAVPGTTSTPTAVSAATNAAAGSVTVRSLPFEVSWASRGVLAHVVAGVGVVDGLTVDVEEELAVAAAADGVGGVGVEALVDDGFGVVQLHPPGETPAGHFGGHGDQKFVFFTRAELHRSETPGFRQGGAGQTFEYRHQRLA